MSMMGFDNPGMEHKMMLYGIMNQTQAGCLQDEVLSESVKKSRRNAELILEKKKLKTKKTGNPKDTQTYFVDSRTLEAAKRFGTNMKTTVLVFADFLAHIGSNPFGNTSQEADICRETTLYPVLKSFEKGFYDKYRKAFEKHKISLYCNDDILYVPDVTVFRTDDGSYQIVNEKDLFNVNVIEAAPIMERYVMNREEYKAAMSKRIRRILDIATLKETECLILGAFGGMSDMPQLVAEAFKEALKDYYFPRVVFAVPKELGEANHNVYFQAFGNTTAS